VRLDYDRQLKIETRELGGDVDRPIVAKNEPFTSLLLVSMENSRATSPRFVIIGMLVIVAGILFVHRHEDQLMAQAERAMPGPRRQVSAFEHRAWVMISTAVARGVRAHPLVLGARA
jgi:hypothetical protein